MKTAQAIQQDASRSGVALIVVLGMLSVMTIMAVTFAIAMRIERVAARNYANGIRAKHLAQTAFVRAMEDINVTMLSGADPAHPEATIYPDWSKWPIDEPGGQPDILVSRNSDGSDSVDLTEGEALDFIPGALQAQAQSMNAEWVDIAESTNGFPFARYAYMVINCSGLVDANVASGSDRVWSTSLSEIDISSLPEFQGDLADFVAERTADKRYETLQEVEAMNSGITTNVGKTTPDNLTVYSFDPGRNQLFLKTPARGLTDWWNEIDTARPPQKLGTREALDYLHDKFNINSITNYYGYKKDKLSFTDYIRAYRDDPTFMSGYHAPLSRLLRTAGITEQNGERPTDVAWNLINYLDADRVPQGADDIPWTHTEGGEPLPLINEIVVTESLSAGTTISNYVHVNNPRLPTYPGYWVVTNAPGGAAYHLNVELWYPFAPVAVTPEDNMYLQVTIFDERETGRSVLDVTNSPKVNQNWSFTEKINMMSYSTNEFLVFSNSVPIVFPPDANGVPGTIGSLQTDGVTKNSFFALARVVIVTNNAIIPVDEAMGYEQGNQRPGKRLLFEFDAVRGYAVNDPRSNGQVKYWTTDGRGEGFSNGGEYDASLHTLGGTNTTVIFMPGRGTVPICDPWSHKGHGLPIWAKNGPMINIGEIGHIFRSNLDDEDPRPNYWYWRNINLMRQDEGAKLLDLMSVLPEHLPQHGVISINSRQHDALYTLFNNMQIGIEGVRNAGLYTIPTNRLQNVIRELESIKALSFTDLFTDEDSDDGGGGPLAEAFRDCAPSSRSSDIYKEDTLRRICELITFRQNLFAVIVAAQAMAPDGNYAVAERRAVALMYRDAYTGRHFTRHFKWLED